MQVPEGLTIGEDGHLPHTCLNPKNVRELSGFGQKIFSTPWPEPLSDKLEGSRVIEKAFTPRNLGARLTKELKVLLFFYRVSNISS